MSIVKCAESVSDLVALGEILIDFTPAGKRSGGNDLFERNPGGAPANVLVCAAKLGISASFIGCVGGDMFGAFLRDALEERHVVTDAMRVSKTRGTTLAFVALDYEGERTFSFYRNPGADTELSPDDLDLNLIRSARIFHFGSLSLTDEPSRSATLAALECARAAGVRVSYDPNLRPALWRSLHDAKDQILSVMGYADIVKISDEELLFLTGERDLSAGSAMLYERFRMPVLLVTCGADGAYFRTAAGEGTVPAFSAGATVDTTGAGDCFLGAFLYCSLSANADIRAADRETIARWALFSSAAAAVCVTRRGAIDAMPSLEEVQALLSR
jgi:sugar/nucleoside kinase (ribokinase family)